MFDLGNEFRKSQTAVATAKVAKRDLHAYGNDPRFHDAVVTRPIATALGHLLVQDGWTVETMRELDCDTIEYAHAVTVVPRKVTSYIVEQLHKERIAALHEALSAVNRIRHEAIFAFAKHEIPAVSRGIEFAEQAILKAIQQAEREAHKHVEKQEVRRPVAP